MFVWLLSTLKTAAFDSFKDKVERSSAQIMTALSQIETVTELLQYNSSLTRYLGGEVQDMADRVIMYRRELDPLLSSVEVSIPHINDLTIYTAIPHPPWIGDDYFNTWTRLPDDILTLTDDVGVGGTWRFSYDENRVLTSLIYYFMLYDSQLRSVIGVIEVKVDPLLILEPLRSFSEQGGMIVLRDSSASAIDGDVYYIAESSVGELIAENRVFRRKIDLGNLPLTVEVTGRTIRTKSVSMGFVLFFLCGWGVLLFLFTWIYSFLFSSLTKRIVALGKHIRDTDHESLELFEDPQKQDDLGALVLHYNALIQRIRSLLDSVKIAETRQKEASLLALQYQMTPHFLYNALESIRMLAESGDCGRAADMAYLVGRFSRYSLSETSSITTVAEEIEHAESFLQIHKARMGDRLNYEILRFGKPDEIPCPRFILQPIVENAIKHGIGNRRRGGFIRIEVDVEGERTRIIVEDDGVGPAASRDSGTRSPNCDPGHGIGLESVHTRLGFFGRSGSGVFLTERDEGGTRVVLCLIPKEGSPIL